jgi:hypothetical protein
MNDRTSWYHCKSFVSILSVFLLLFFLVGCRSAFVDADIQNRTGAPLQLIEVDYPSASFGTGALATNASFHYRFKIQGSGNVQLSYSDSSGKAHHVRGPELKEGQQGILTITINSPDSVHWTPVLSEKR